MSDTSTPWEGAGASGKMAPQELSPGSGEPVLGPGEKEMHLKVRRGLAPAGWDATLRKCQEAGRKGDKALHHESWAVGKSIPAISSR